jgi:hypothetical protein
MGSGSHSWFDIAVVDVPEGSNIDRETPCLGRWKSHYNGFAEARYEPYDGIFFGPEHDMWKVLKPGYRLALFSNVDVGGWICEVHDVRFTAWEWYRPVDDDISAC